MINDVICTEILIRYLVHPGLRSCLSSPRLRLLGYTYLDKELSRFTPTFGS